MNFKEQVLEILKDALTFEIYTFGNPNIETNLHVKVLIDGEVIQEIDTRIS